MNPQTNSVAVIQPSLRIGQPIATRHEPPRATPKRQQTAPTRSGKCDGEPAPILPKMDAVRWVWVLAFCQSLLFLIIWLCLCFSAAGATKPAAEAPAIPVH